MTVLLIVLVILVLALALALAVVWRGRASHVGPIVSKPRGWDRKRAVPEFVKGLVQLANDRPHGKDIVITKLRLRINLKILVPNIASAYERDRVVSD